MKVKYEVYTWLDGKNEKGWITCKAAAPIKFGMLHYELKDGTNAFAAKDEWRIKK